MDCEHTSDADNVDGDSKTSPEQVTAPNILHSLPQFDSSIPLLITSIPNGNDEGPSQERDTRSSDEEPPPLPTRLGIALFILCLLPLLIIIISIAVLMATEIDPLGLCFMAFLLLFSLVPCALGIILLVRVSASYIMKLCPHKLSLEPGSDGRINKPSYNLGPDNSRCNNEVV